jgi:hypothetical protein
MRRNAARAILAALTLALAAACTNPTGPSASKSAKVNADNDVSLIGQGPH